MTHHPTRPLGLTVLAGVVVAAATTGCSASSSPNRSPATGAVLSSSVANTTATSTTTETAATRVLAETGVPGTPRGSTAPPSTAATAPTSPTAPVSVSAVAATTVAAAFTVATFTKDTALDRSGFDAQLRSAAWATPAYAEVLVTPVPVTGDAEFTLLAAHHGYTTATVVPNTDDGAPPEDLRSAARSFTVAITGHGDDGWSQTLTPRTIYVFLTRAGPGAAWLVERAKFSSVIPASDR